MNKLFYVRTLLMEKRRCRFLTEAKAYSALGLRG